MRARRDDRASGSTIGIVSAMALLAIALTVPAGLEPAAVAPLEHASLRHEAEGVLRSLTGSAGADGWAADPLNASAIGLLEARSRALDEQKVDALRRVPPDQLYDALRGGAGATTDFRIALEPLLPSLDDASWRPLGLRSLAYLAQERGPASPLALTPSVLVTSRLVNVSAVVTNVGAAPAIYTVEMGLGDPLQNVVQLAQNRHTRLLAPNESQTVWATFPALPTWDAGISGARVKVTDHFENDGETSDGRPIGSVWTRIGSMPRDLLASYHHLLSAERDYYEGAERVRFELDHYGALGAHVTNARGVFSLVGPDGREWVNQTVSLPSLAGAVHTYECSNCTMEGVYRATLWDTSLARRQADQVVYSALPLFVHALALDPRAATEASALAELVERFQPTRFHTILAPGGDVYGDKAHGASRLTENLGKYDTIVIGSNVAQSALTPNAAKQAIRAWVEGGGTLIVLGSQDGPQEWMNPLWHVSLARTSAEAAPHDASHAALRAPEALDPASYPTWGRLWSARDATQFERVLGAPGHRMLDALAVSQPGAFGDGTLLLSAHTPGNLTGAPDVAQAKRILHNLLVHAHTRFYFEGGAPLPSHLPVASADRLLVGEDPLFPEGLPVRVRVWTFR